MDWDLVVLIASVCGVCGDDGEQEVPFPADGENILRFSRADLILLE